MKHLALGALALVLSVSALGSNPITVFGVLEKNTIEPVGVTYLSLTDYVGGPTRFYRLSFQEAVVDPSRLVGRSALVTLSSKPTPAPQTGVLYPVLSITLYPTLESRQGTLKVNLTQGGYLVTLTTATARYSVKLGEKSTRLVAALGVGEHANVTVMGAINGRAMTAENIR